MQRIYSVLFNYSLLHFNNKTNISIISSDWVFFANVWADLPIFSTYCLNQIVLIRIFAYVRQFERFCYPSWPPSLSRCWKEFLNYSKKFDQQFIINGIWSAQGTIQTFTILYYKFFHCVLWRFATVIVSRTIKQYKIILQLQIYYVKNRHFLLIIWFG